MSYKSTRRPFDEAFETVMLGRGRLDGIIRHRTVDEETPMVELGAYFIGPSDSLLWVECLFWGSLADESIDVIPLSVKWGLMPGEARSFTRLVSDEGIARLAAWHVLAKMSASSVPQSKCDDSECAGGGPPCIDHVEL